MLAPVLVTLLSAAPVDVVAAWGSDAAAGVAKLADPKRTRIEASGPYAYFMHPDGVMPMQDFGTFRAEPIPGWPAELNDTWAKGLAYCRSLVGPPPWRKVMGIASGCGNRLGLHLWQRLASFHHAERVFELESFVDTDANTSRVLGRRWTPGTGKFLLFHKEGRAADVRALVDEATAALLTEKGASWKPLHEYPEMAKPLGADPWAAEAAFTEPAVKLEKSCAKLPKKLTFTSASPLAASLAVRWAPAEATGAPLACELTFGEHEETPQLINTPISITTSTVTCGSAVAAVELSKLRLAKKPVLETLTESLSQLLAAQLCR